MYSETVSHALWELLSLLNKIPGIDQCYLGGGTALSLQLGHRKSEDLDFFARNNIEEVFNNFNTSTYHCKIHIINQTTRHIELMINSIKVDLIKEQIPLRFQTKSLKKEIPNIRIADPKDIGRMKIISISSRGCKKDFIDLYCLTRNTITLADLIELVLKENQGIKYSRLHFLKGLIDFESADKEVNPFMIWEIDWKKVKNTLISEIMDIADKINIQ